MIYRSIYLSIDLSIYLDRTVQVSVPKLVLSTFHERVARNHWLLLRCQTQGLLPQHRLVLSGPKPKTRDRILHRNPYLNHKKVCNIQTPNLNPSNSICHLGIMHCPHRTSLPPQTMQTLHCILRDCYLHVVVSPDGMRDMVPFS